MRKYVLPMMVLAAALCFSAGCDEPVAGLDGAYFQKGNLEMNPRGILRRGTRVIDAFDIEP